MTLAARDAGSLGVSRGSFMAYSFCALATAMWSFQADFFSNRLIHKKRYKRRRAVVTTKKLLSQRLESVCCVPTAS